MSIKSASILLALLLIATTARAETPPADAAKENAELKAKVEQLQKQVDELVLDLAQSRALQRQAEALAAQRFSDRLIYTPTTQPAMPAAPAKPKMPRGAVEKKFDDITFYVIPINEGMSINSTADRNSVHTNK
jgi:hypothetical protein